MLTLLFVSFVGQASNNLELLGMEESITAGIK